MYISPKECLNILLVNIDLLSNLIGLLIEHMRICNIFIGHTEYVNDVKRDCVGNIKLIKSTKVLNQ